MDCRKYKRNETMKNILRRTTCIVLALVIAFATPALGVRNNDAIYAASKIHLNSTAKTLVEGTTFQLKLVNAKAKNVKWSSTDTDVAKVSSKGKVTAVSPGTAKIRAKYKKKTYISKFTVNPAPYDSIPLSDALQTATDYHAYLQGLNLSADSIKSKLNNNTSRTCDITLDEINSLKKPSSGTKTKVSYDEAVADINLYFNALRYGYGAYEYFGGDQRFNKAKANILKTIKGESTVAVNDLREAMRSELKYVRDGHFGIGPSAIEDRDVRYEYFYDYSQVFRKDGKGLYKEISGKKWYYKNASNKNVRVELTLLPNGEIAYSPMLFLPATKKKDSYTITLENGKSKKKVKLNFKENRSYLDNSSNNVDFKYLSEQGATYISFRRFGDEQRDQLQGFVNSGSKARGSKVVIMDIRSNSGGPGNYGTEWMRNFSGQEPRINEIWAHKKAALTTFQPVFASYGSETMTIEDTTGRVIANETPVIVLLDDKCGSSGEVILAMLKCMKNVIVIGSNSSGCQICGNVSHYTLPNTGIGITIPVSLHFQYTLDEVDGKGYEPDIWCNPRDCYSYVLKMLEKQGYISAETGEKLYKITPRQGSMTLDWQGYSITPGSGFGRITDDYCKVKCDGKVIKDYTVKSDDTSLLKTTVGTDGRLHLVAVKNEGRDVQFTITYQGMDFTFRAHL